MFRCADARRTRPRVRCAPVRANAAQSFTDSIVSCRTWRAVASAKPDAAAAITGLRVGTGVNDAPRICAGWVAEICEPPPRRLSAIALFFGGPVVPGRSEACRVHYRHAEKTQPRP